MRLIVILLFLWSGALFGQQKEKETWYIWIDTSVSFDGETVRVVSDEVLAITCCVKSGKYRRFSEKTRKWIMDNVSAEVNAESPLKKLKDRDLAEQIVNDAKLQAADNNSIKIVHYDENCK